MSTVTVPTDTVIYAVRYCIGRFTYADSDARALLRATWKDLSVSDRAVVLRDIDNYLADCKQGLYPASGQSVSEWCRLRYELGGDQP